MAEDWDCGIFQHRYRKYVNGVVVSPWNKLFRHELLDGFRSIGYLGEDEDMNDYALSKSDVKVSMNVLLVPKP